MYTQNFSKWWWNRVCQQPCSYSSIGKWNTPSSILSSYFTTKWSSWMKTPTYNRNQSRHAFNARALPSLWVDAFNTTTYVINLVPTKILYHKSLFEVLFKSKPNYAMFQTFGFHVFPYLWNYSAHKLYPWSIDHAFWLVLVHTTRVTVVLILQPNTFIQIILKLLMSSHFHSMVSYLPLYMRIWIFFYFEEPFSIIFPLETPSKVTSKS